MMKRIFLTALAFVSVSAFAVSSSQSVNTNVRDIKFTSTEVAGVPYIRLKLTEVAGVPYIRLKPTEVAGVPYIRLK
ncbi:hypothetical protein PY479_17435, partial [Shewanella sp. A32]|nr:hypothetical protein [Shewanella sp. A32]